MKRVIFLSALAAVLGSGTLFAEELTHEVAIEATVPKVCSFDSGPTADGTAFSVTDRENSVFTVAIDPTSGRVITTNDSLTFTNAFCNTGSTLTLSRNGLTTGAPASGSFANQIQYLALVSWGSASFSLPLGGTNSVTDSIGPQTGNLTLEIIVPTDGLLIPGDYSDTLTLNIAPPV